MSVGVGVHELDGPREVRRGTEEGEDVHVWSRGAIEEDVDPVLRGAQTRAGEVLGKRPGKGGRWVRRCPFLCAGIEVVGEVGLGGRQGRESGLVRCRGCVQCDEDLTLLGAREQRAGGGE